MADAETAQKDTSLRLQVAAARQEESGHGIARMPKSAFAALGRTEGDVVEITGKRTTAASAVPAYQEDQELSVVRLDGLQRGNAQIVRAGVPLSELFGYATALRSLSQGRANYSMQFSHYDEVPANVAAEVKEKLA